MGLSQGSDLGAVGERHYLCAHADHPARRREGSALATGRGLCNPIPRTVRAAAESAAAGTPRNN